MTNQNKKENTMIENTKATKAKKEEEPKINVLPFRVEVFDLKIVGDSALISHRWSEKAKAMIRDKQMKKTAKTGRETRNPQQEFEDSLYKLPGGGYGFPAVAFKAAAVDACSQVPDITKVLARGAFHVVGEMIRIEGEPEMREDMVKIGMGTADLRYRGEFKNWSCVLQIRYNPDVLSKAQIKTLFSIAGFAVGVGEWRPQRDGMFGLYHVED